MCSFKMSYLQMALLSIWLLGNPNVYADTLSETKPLLFVTENLPPFQVVKSDNSLTGAMVEVVELLIKEAQLKANIEVYPWARTYQLALNEPNVIIFSILKDKARKDKFHWLGHLYSLRTYLAALKSRPDIRVASLSDAKSYRIGTIREDLAESYLLTKGFIPEKNLYLSAIHYRLWQQLFKGRTDLVMTNDMVWRHEIKSSKLNPQDVKLIYQVTDFPSELYLASSLSTDKKIRNKLSLTLKKIKSDGRFQQIMKKWQLSK